MAIITSDTFLDDGTARTPSETWTINGGILTVRTDTRWHIGKPAGTRGTLSTITISPTLGGGILIDGRNVREITFNSGAGNVPAIGTMISQGGVEGYLLGVWPDLASAPIEPASAMPATGFIKFREVTGGSFSAGALTGIDASSDGTDTISWIEFVQRQSIANTIPRLGFFRTRGDWYTLPQTTSGVAGQIIQIPTNGGGAGTAVPAIWIETGIGTNEYESFPTILGTGFIPANLGVDERAKFCENMGNGQVRIGSNGTDNVGFLPDAGRRIRIPNILGRQTALGGEAVNSSPSMVLATRPDYNTTASGGIDFEFFMSDSYFLFSVANNVFLKNCATFDNFTTTNNGQACEVDNLVVAPFTISATICLVLTSNTAGGYVRNSKFFRLSASGSGHSANINLSSDYEFDNCHFGIITYARSTGRSVNIGQCKRCSFEDIYQYNGFFVIAACNTLTIKNLDHNDRFVGNTNAAAPINCFSISVASANILIDGITFGMRGVVSSFCNPYNSLLLVDNSLNVTIRNAGTFTNKLRVQNATFAPTHVITDGGNNDTVKAQRLYLEFTRVADFAGLNTSNGFTLESCQGTAGIATSFYATSNLISRGGQRSLSITSISASVYGSHFFDYFFSNTSGALTFTGNENTLNTSSVISLVLTNSNGGFTASGGCSLPNVGDSLTITSPYFILGHTAFGNVAPAFIGTNSVNFLLEFDLDTGSGFSGIFQVLNGANLSASSIAASGFRIRLRISCVTAGTGNLFRYVNINTESTFNAQRDNLYPLETALVQVNGLSANSRVQIFDTVNDIEFFNGVVSGTSFSLSIPFSTPFNLRTRVMYASDSTANIFYESNNELVGSGLIVNVENQIDSVYVVNGIDGFSVTGIQILDNLFLIEIDSAILPIIDVYAYCVAWLYSEEGIRDEGQFIEALDQANYIVSEFKIKNISSPSIPLSLTGGWVRDAITNTTVEIIDNSGGSIFSNPDLVIPFSSGSGLSPAQDATLSKLDILTENVSGLRFTEKALEEASGGGSLTAAEVWSHTTRELTTTIPTASQNASQVRTELSTELARIDVDISSRNSVAPNNADIVLIKAKTDTLVNTDLTGIATSTNVTDSQVAIIAEVNANETKLDEIKVNTNLIPAAL